jgi:putative ABC transport system ATP-binding protein
MSVQEIRTTSAAEPGTSVSGPLVAMEDVSRVFLTDEVETHALSKVSLCIHEGQYAMIAGPSGCGKSTLLSIIGLLDSATEGRYHFQGQDVTGLSIAQRARIRNRQIGFVFQNFNLIGDLTVHENVALPLRYRRMISSEARRRVGEALEQVDMAHRMKHYPAQLSGGQQQRVAVARALAGNPAIILADEPTGNLDSENSLMVMEILKSLHRRGATICMVTHDPRYTGYADVSFNLLDGRIVPPARA